MGLFGGKKLKIQERLGDFAGACYCIAAADGQVADGELQTIAQSIVSLTDGATPVDEIKRLLDVARDEVGKRGLEGYMKSLGRDLDRDGKAEILAGAAKTLAADGKMSPEEELAYTRLAKTLGFSIDEANEILSEAT